MNKTSAPETVKHFDHYTTEDLNADVEAFQRALNGYLRARRVEQRRVRKRSDRDANGPGRPR